MKALDLEAVGAFQKLPMVMPSVDILYSSLRKAKRVSPTKGNFVKIFPFHASIIKIASLKLAFSIIFP